MVYYGLGVFGGGQRADRVGVEMIRQSGDWRRTGRPERKSWMEKGGEEGIKEQGKGSKMKQVANG